MLKLLLTGACGTIGRHFAPVAAHHYDLRIADRIAWDDEQSGPLDAEKLVLDLSTRSACDAACAGVDCVVHLAADPSPKATWETLLPDNILATLHIMQAAEQAGCRRFVFASSAQAVAGYPLDVQVHPDMAVRPRNLYGVSKCFGEALAAMIGTQSRMGCVAVRIGHYKQPQSGTALDGRNMSAFLHPDDLNQLLLLALQTPDVDYALVQAISDNRFKRLDITGARRQFNFRPEANAFELFDLVLDEERKHPD